MWYADEEMLIVLQDEWQAPSAAATQAQAREQEAMR
jgi:hypothetical protein